MKKLFLMLFITCLLMACSLIPQPTATLAPTVAPSETSAPEPTLIPTPSPTASPTLVPTVTPTLVPTQGFYAIDPTVAATASTCKADPDKTCVSALIISLDGRKLDEYGVYISYAGFSGTSFECPQQALLVEFGDKNMAPVICSAWQITFISVGLTELTITISWGTGSITQTVRPTFEVSAPQGPNCKPQCLVGKAKIHIP